MWNKREDEPSRPAGGPHAALPPTAVTTRREQQATIGPSISIVGDLTGTEDITILGRVRGKIDLPQHTVTVGEAGHIDADIHAKVVSVAGEVHGNLAASEQILIRKTATMLGNLTAPRVGLEEGCRFRGSVDMEAQPEKRQASSTATSPAPGAAAAGKPAEPAAQPAGSPDGDRPTKPEAQLVRRP